MQKSLSFADYMDSIKEAMDGIDESIRSVAGILGTVKKNGGKLVVLGNGGSLSIAQHMAQDVLKMCGMRAMTINCPSMITAFSNDDGFEYSYFNPVSKMIDERDAVLIFSCSGKSRNYIEFVSGFPEKRMTVASVVGTDGGFLKEKSEACIHIKSFDYQVCESAFCIVSDLLVKSLMED